MPKNHFKTNLFFSIMTPPTPSPNLSGHVHRLIIENKTKKGHNLVCWHPKNYPYHTEFVSWRVDHFSFFFYFPIRRGGGVSALLEFSNNFFLKPSVGQKKFWTKKFFGRKMFLVEKSFLSKNFFGWKNFLAKTFRLKKFFGQKNLRWKFFCFPIFK